MDVSDFDSMNQPAEKQVSPESFRPDFPSFSITFSVLNLAPPWLEAIERTMKNAGAEHKPVQLSSCATHRNHNVS